jgi:predicted sulfurtransferase
MLDPNTVVIDVRNFNETVIGKFAPPCEPLVSRTTGEVLASKVLDPYMRRSTEFPQWVKDHKPDLVDKKVLMYCTAGVRCERASSFLKNQGIDQVYQLEGGIHRYLEAFPEDGGFWVGKNYTFDKRFNHGAANAVTVSQCVYCKLPWDRYQAQKKCGVCSMEVLLCKECQKIKPNIPRAKLICPLCEKK